MPNASAISVEDMQKNGGIEEITKRGEQIDEPMREVSLKVQILKIVNYFLTFLGLIAIVAIIYYGFLFIISGGDEELYTKARNGIFYVGLGIIVILLSYALVSFFINATSSA